MKSAINISILCLSLIACHKKIIPTVSTKVQTTKDVTTKREITETVKDTTIVINQDQSLIDMLFECDSANNVLIKKINSVRPGLHVAPPAVNLQNNRMVAKCIVDSFAVYFSYKERYEKFDSTVESKTDSTATIIVPVKDGCVSGFQWFQIWVGRIALLLILLIVGWKWASKKIFLPLKFMKWGK